ncbi:MAG: myo-inosose-2 dehydratase [Proteobacteria bacterium]|nr:myo-inosose-2 dehydratase [Pseudomonadota bacterium]
MAIPIGINPLTWTNDDMPELGADTPLEVCLAEAKQAGYDGVELGNKFPRKADQLRPILARHGLKLVSGWYSARLLERSAAEEIAAAEDHLSLLLALGCTAMVFAEVTGAVHGSRGTKLSRRPRLGDGDWARFGQRMTDVARALAKRGMKMAYHHHMGTVVETAAEIDRLMAATGPEVGLLLDTGHLTYAGGDPLAVARQYGSRLTHVHCKDVRVKVLEQAKRDDWAFLDAVLAGVFTVPGDGCVDYRALLPLLKEKGYRGWLVVEAEQDPVKAHPLTYARMGHDYLRLLARTAGL